jgi:hypothetical protein
MNRQIVILDQLASDDRTALWDKAEAEFKDDFTFTRIRPLDEIKAFVDSLGSAPEPPFVVFGHDTDLNRARVQKRGKLISECEKKKIPLVLYSGGSNEHQLDSLLIEELKDSVLAENLGAFLSNAKKLTSLDTDDLGKLIGVDPILELLLGNFASVSPFEVDSKLSSAKQQLQRRVDQLVRGQE